MGPDHEQSQAQPSLHTAPPCMKRALGASRTAERTSVRLLRAAPRLRAFDNHSDSTAPIPAAARGGKKSEPGIEGKKHRRRGTAGRGGRRDWLCGMRARDARMRAADGEVGAGREGAARAEATGSRCFGPRGEALRA